MTTLAVNFDFSQLFQHKDLQFNLLISVIIFISAFVLHYLAFKILKRVNRKDKNLADSLDSKLKIPGLVLILTVSLEVILKLFGLKNELVFYVNHGLYLLLIFTIALLFNRIISIGKEIILSKYDIKEKDNLKARSVYTQFKILERILNVIVIIIAIAVALLTFESIRKVGVSLFASAGVAGIILGLAAQRMIGTVIAGFQIAITQPIRLEDVVIVESEWGWIEEITLTYVVIRIWDKRRLIVPTTYFIEKPFQNWTRVSADILGTVFIYTDYSVPFDDLREELTKILKSDPNWDGNVNNLQVTNSTDKTVEIRALMSAVDSPTAWDLRVNVREKLIGYLQKNYPDSLPKSRLIMEKL